MTRTAQIACALALLGAPLTAQAQTYPGVSQGSYASGCLDEGATMYISINGASESPRVDLYGWDNPSPGAAGTGPDGLIDEIWCGSAVSVFPPELGALPPYPGPLSCGDGTLFELSCEGLDFFVWLGADGDDDADCSGLDRPVVMYAGFGQDQLTGSQFGDFIHGGQGSDNIYGESQAALEGGDDFICGAGAMDLPNATGSPLPVAGENFMYGLLGNDMIWGGPNPDTIYGNKGDDYVHGAVSSDYVNGGQDNDFVFGGDENDVLDGGTGHDILHGGNGHDTLQGGPDNDELRAQDAHADETVSGGDGADTCWFDAGTGEADPDCEVLERRFQCDGDYPVLVATEEESLAVLYQLGIAGGHYQSGNLRNPADTAFADQVVGLAVDPLDCITYALMEVGGQQVIATIDTIMEPGLDLDYHSGAHCTVGEGDLVDIAFDASGGLAGLDATAHFKRIHAPASGGGGACVYSDVQLLGRDASFQAAGEGYRMAWDDPDGGLFLALTKDPDTRGGQSDLSTMDAYDPASGLMITHEDHIPALNLGQYPFTVTQADLVGTLLTIEPVPGGGDPTQGCDADTYRMLKLSRRNWEIKRWNKEPCKDDVCCAEINSTPTAITVPHFVDLVMPFDPGRFYIDLILKRALAQTVTQWDAASFDPNDPHQVVLANELIVMRDALLDVQAQREHGCDPVNIVLKDQRCDPAAGGDCIEVQHDADRLCPVLADISGSLFNNRIDLWTLTLRDQTHFPGQTGVIDIDKGCKGPHEGTSPFAFCAQETSWGHATGDDDPVFFLVE